MSELTNTKQFKDWITKQLIQKKDEVAEMLFAYFVGKLLQHQPTEDGHAHEAWITGCEQLNLDKVNRVVSYSDGKRSHDPKATQYGEGHIESSKLSTTITVTNNLPFVYKLEYGLPISVGDDSGNQGRKINPVKRPPEKGPLYGKRNQGSEGLLVFERGGMIIKAKTWTHTEHRGFLDKAVKETVSFIKSKGLKVRQRRI